MDLKSVQTPPRTTLARDFSIPPTPLLNSLGYGTGVNVWSYNTLRSPWAVKNVRNAMQKIKKDQYQKLIDKEAKILSTLNHENIIGFRGLLKALDGRHCLAMELGGKSLGELTEERECTIQKPFPPEQIFKVTVGVARALHYLHSDKKILHGDIKSYNILIRDNFKTIKLCDLGVCVEMNNGSANSYTGTLIYNAPEVIDDNSCHAITGKAEIFSLGLVIWEMMALSPPHCLDESSDFSEDEYVDTNEDSVIILDNSVTGSIPGTRPQLPEALGLEYQPVIHLFNMCTEADPNKRPSALEIIQYVEKIA